MVTKLTKINPVSYRIGFSFFWNKSVNNTKKKYTKFLKFVYLLSYFFTILFEKFFKFQIYRLHFFFKQDQILFNFNVYSFNLMFFSILNCYLPKLYQNSFELIELKLFRKLKKSFFLTSKYKNQLVKLKHLSLLSQELKFITVKITNNKQFIFFFNEFLATLLKKKVNCFFFDNIELWNFSDIIVFFLAKNIKIYSRLKLKIKNYFFYFLILSSWISLIQKDSYFFTKLVIYGLKTRTQKVFIRFIKKLLLTFFFLETPKLKILTIKANKLLKGLFIGIFGKIFGRRRSKKMYLTYYKKKTLLNSLNFKKINFTYLKSWTYYGIFGIKVWFFF